MKTKKLVLSSMFIAMGTLLGSVVQIPIGGSICFPLQHAINVMGAVFLGPVYTVMNAFCISLLRNLLGVGTLLAFPGSMIGALVASILFKLFKRKRDAAIGEVIGTGVIGSLLAIPIARAVIGLDVGAFFFILPFSLSSISGAIIGYVLVTLFEPLGRRFFSDEGHFKHSS